MNGGPIFIDENLSMLEKTKHDKLFQNSNDVNKFGGNLMEHHSTFIYDTYTS